MAINDQSRWRFVATDLTGATAASGAGMVLNASQKQYSHHLNSGKTAQFTLNIDNPAANFVLTHDCLLKVYRKTRVAQNWALLMVGDIIHAEESGQGDAGLLTVVASDPWWRLQRRLLGYAQDSIGRGIGYTDGSATSLVDYSEMVYHVLNNCNSVWNTGIQAGTLILTGSSSFLGPVYMQNAGDTIQQFCNVLGGPEIEMVPMEPIGAWPNTIIAQMNIWKALGQSRPNTAFEYGTGQRNVATYDRVLSKDGLCNQAFSPPQGFPGVSTRGDQMVIGQDSTSINAMGIYQDVVQGDMVSVDLRQKLANEYVNIRRYARQQITFTPTVDCPLDYTVDYNVGDTVTARAFVSGGYRYNGTARIYGVDFSVDDNDAETPALTLIPSS